MENESAPIKNILFYSDKCQYCVLFIKKLHSENMLPNFKLINVHELKQIPAAITNVPTIIVNNINVPLSGINAFEWLEKTKYFYQRTNNINVKVNHININQDTSMCIEDTKIHKPTDIYANLKDEDDEKRTKIKFNGATQNISITDATDIKQTIHDQKINSDLQAKKLNELIMARKNQMAQFLKGRGNEAVTKL
jgi:hypothetical protein